MRPLGENRGKVPIPAQERPPDGKSTHTLVQDPRSHSPYYASPLVVETTPGFRLMGPGSSGTRPGALTRQRADDVGAAQGPPDGGRRRDTRAGEGAPAAAAAVAGRDVSLTPRRGCLVRVRRASARARRACADAPPKRLGPTPLLRCGMERASPGAQVPHLLHGSRRPSPCSLSSLLFRGPRSSLTPAVPGGVCPRCAL